jgi:hypothetical protein
MGRHVKDVTGQRFGMRVAMWPVGYSPNGKVGWLCLCDCGNYHPTSSFRTSPTCGCVGRAKSAERIRMVACRRAKPGERPALRHGLSPTPTYSCYLGQRVVVSGTRTTSRKGYSFASRLSSSGSQSWDIVQKRGRLWASTVLRRSHKQRRSLRAG